MIYLDELSEKEEISELPVGSSYYLCDVKGNIIYSIHENKNSEAEIKVYIQKVLEEILEGKHDVADSFTIDMQGKKKEFIIHCLKMDGYLYLLYLIVLF